MIDTHCHILPGLDDGSNSMEESLEMLRIAYDEGIRTMIATPHNMPGKGCPSKRKVEKRLSELQMAAFEAGIEMEILLGTEYFYREDVIEYFEEDQIIPIADSKCVLVEFDPTVGRKYVKNAIREVLAQDYIPIIAHVERYVELMEKKQEAVQELRTMGALIQVNTGSITGKMGLRTKMNTRSLLKQGLVDLIGTDAHSSRHRAPRMAECAKYLEKTLDKEAYQRLITAAALAEHPKDNN